MFHSLWPGARVELHPIIPAFGWWKSRELIATRSGMKCFASFFDVVALGESHVGCFRHAHSIAPLC